MIMSSEQGSMIVMPMQLIARIGMLQLMHAMMMTLLLQQRQQ
jgi:hypothetical protein